MTQFCKISKKKWSLENIHGARLRRLQEPPSFKDIIFKIKKKAKVSSCKPEFCDKKGFKNYQRYVIELEIDEILVDLFHNSRTGYRAQYFYSEEQGEVANKYALEELIGSPFSRFLDISYKKDSETKLKILDSITHPNSKIWIHQGPWMHPKHGMKIHRNLHVSKWKAHLTDTNSIIVNKVRLGILTPDDEIGLTIIGEFLDSNGNVPSFVRKNRPREINLYGFT